MTDMNTAAQAVKNIISQNKIVVFSKTYCPYCVKAKNLLESIKVPFAYVNLEQEDEGPEMQAELMVMTGQKTVPNIWIGEKFVGGFSDLSAKKESGELQGMLKAAGLL